MQAIQLTWNHKTFIRTCQKLWIIKFTVDDIKHDIFLISYGIKDFEKMNGIEVRFDEPDTEVNFELRF
jgi:hypothetical protein